MLEDILFGIGQNSSFRLCLYFSTRFCKWSFSVSNSIICSWALRSCKRNTPLKYYQFDNNNKFGSNKWSKAWFITTILTLNVEKPTSLASLRLSASKVSSTDSYTKQTKNWYQKVQCMFLRSLANSQERKVSFWCLSLLLRTITYCVLTVP